LFKRRGTPYSRRQRWRKGFLKIEIVKQLLQLGTDNIWVKGIKLCSIHGQIPFKGEIITTRIPPIVHNIPVNILDTVVFKSHDLCSFAPDNIGHHKTETYF
jgi:hypothetical protein